jgi:hypothetical protein
MININPDKFLPGIILNKEEKIFKIFGKSCPIDAINFYTPILEWFDEYIKDPLENTILDIQLNYFNTATAKALLKILKKIERLHEAGYSAKVRWFYPEYDEDMEETGRDFNQIINVDFIYIPLEKAQEEMNIKEELLKMDIFHN